MDFQPGQPGRIVLTASADPLLDPDLSDGAVRLLMLIRSLAGHSRTLVTLTQSLATQLHRHPDTIRKWRDELEAGSYIHCRTDPRTGRTTILVREPVEPPSRRAQVAAQREEDAKPAPLPWQKPGLVILKPDPKPWGTLPQVKPWRQTRAGALVCQGGAELRRDIKTRKTLLILSSSPVPARASEEPLRQAPPVIRAGSSWEAQPPVRTPAEQIAAIMGTPAQAASWEEVPAPAKDGQRPALTREPGRPTLPRASSGDACLAEISGHDRRINGKPDALRVDLIEGARAADLPPRDSLIDTVRGADDELMARCDGVLVERVHALAVTAAEIDNEVARNTFTDVSEALLCEVPLCDPRERVWLRHLADAHAQNRSQRSEPDGRRTRQPRRGGRRT